MAFGLTPQGFVPKTTQDLVDEMRADLRGRRGANIDLSETSNWSQLTAVFADRLSELWSLGEDLYSSGDSDLANDAALVSISAITGTKPEPATASTMVAYATGTPGTILVVGRQSSTTVTKTKFSSTGADATLVAAAAWAISTAYAAGAVRTNGGSVYYCSIAGTSAGSGGPSGTGTAIADGSATWRFIGLGTAYAVISWTCAVTGPFIAAAGTLTTIETPVSGWQSVNNLVDATVGQNADTNAQLRLRRQDELFGSSRSTVDSIRTRLSEDVAGISTVIVFENDTEVTNVDGMPPHSVECLVQGGVDQDIVNAVFSNVAAGITTFGNQPGTFVDLNNGGQTYTVKWSRPVNVNVWIAATVIYDPLKFPLDGSARITSSLLASGSDYDIGQDVVSSKLKAQCFGQTVTDPITGEISFVVIPGVLDVSLLKIGTAPSPTLETTIVMAARQLALLDSTRVAITLVAGTP